MKKPDYSDLEAAESIGHIFGFVGPIIAVVVLVVIGLASLLG